MSRITTAAVPIHFQSKGHGPALLFLHAFPLDGRMWQAQVDGLAGAYRVLVPDMPGFGKGEPSEGKPSLDEWARTIIAQCRAGGVDRAVVAGCSMGGYLAFAMHRFDATFSTGFALISTRATADSLDAKRARYEMVEKARHEGSDFLLKTDPPVSPQTHATKPDVIAAIRQMQADATSVGLMTAQRAMASRRDSRSLLATIRVPVVVVRGDDDPVISRTEAESMIAAIPGARFITIPNVGHFPPLEEPAVVTDILRKLAKEAFA